ncbi:hypothetical protein IV203_019924 [Nitzschia inconspicua]|uniref:F-box domain-containing protein n=1 Tax=Nitzschia inconspicua TaxID=303405 RepID=A0A9K3Q7T2_9STRA|nr:hypothetical protein IV203_019924 [Nitzschia inconspicua]
MTVSAKYDSFVLPHEKIPAGSEDVVANNDAVDIETLFSGEVGNTVAAFLGVQDLLRMSETNKFFASILSREDPHMIWKQVEDTELTRHGQPPRDDTFPRIYDVKTHALILRMQNEIKHCSNLLNQLRNHHDIMFMKCFRNRSFYRERMTKERELAAIQVFYREIPMIVARRSNLEASLFYPNDPRATEVKASAIYEENFDGEDTLCASEEETNPPSTKKNHGLQLVNRLLSSISPRGFEKRRMDRQERLLENRHGPEIPWWIVKETGRL